MKRKIVAATVAFLIGVPAGVLAVTALQIDSALVPIVGQTSISTCDTDGVTVSYGYGSTRPGGIRVSSVTVDGIAAGCTAAAVEFVGAGGVVATYSADAVDGSATVATSIFTDQFTDVRVALLP